MSAANFVGALLFQAQIASVKTHLEDLGLANREFSVIEHIDNVPDVGPCMLKKIGKPVLLAIQGPYAGLMFSTEYKYAKSIDNPCVERIFNDEWYDSNPDHMPYDIFHPESACVDCDNIKELTESSPTKALLYSAYYSLAREVYKKKCRKYLGKLDHVPNGTVLLSDMLRVAAQRAGFNINVDALHMTRPVKS